MRNAWLVSAGLVLIGSTRVGSPPVIVSAYVDNGGLLFNAPVEPNWDSLLPPALRPAGLAGDRARRQQLFEKRSEGGFTEVPYPANLPSVLQRRFYYLFDSAGIREIRPTALQGTARIRWTGDGAVVGEVKTFGGMRAQVSSNGGFVLSTDGRTTLKLEPSTRSADTLLAPRGGEYPQKGTPFWQIVRQYQVTQTGPTTDSWVWVQWRGDTAMVEAGCTYRFSLFHLMPEPVMVSSTDYGCDV